MRVPDHLSIRARLRIAIVALVSAIVLAMTATHLQAVAGESFEDTGSRATFTADVIRDYLLESGSWFRLEAQSDPLLTKMLGRMVLAESPMVNVLVKDARGRILGAADREHAATAEADSWTDWQKRHIAHRLLDLLGRERHLVLESAIVPPGSSSPEGKVQVCIAPGLLRKSIAPQMEELGWLAALSLLLSAAMGIIVSKVFGDAFERLGEKIDLIAQGDLGSMSRDRFVSPELIDLESKLWWLGRQYTGARTDIARLRHSVEQMLRRLEEVILVFGSDGRVQIAGEAAQRLLGRPREEFTGKPLSDLFPAWTRAGHVLNEALRERKPVRDAEVTFERANLPAARLLLSVEPLVDEDGSGGGLLVTLRDADTRQQLRADLDTARRLAAIGRITSGVAHEIKNPLNAMMLHLEIAADKVSQGNDASAEIGIVKGELLRLDRVVKALLEFNRPVDVQLLECDLNSISEEVATLIRPQAEAGQIMLVVECDVRPAVVLADPYLLKQGVINVAVNGIEATSAGGCVRLRVEQRDGEGILAVEDTGTGIAPENRDKIFNLYYTTKSSGTGVGLAMTYRIMQLLNGTITFDSEVGKGSCFKLRLPSRPLADAAA